MTGCVTRERTPHQYSLWFECLQASVTRMIWFNWLTDWFFCSVQNQIRYRIQKRQAFCHWAAFPKKHSFFDDGSGGMGSLSLGPPQCKAGSWLQSCHKMLRLLRFVISSGDGNIVGDGGGGGGGDGGSSGDSHDTWDLRHARCWTALYCWAAFLAPRQFWIPEPVLKLIKL